MICRYKDRKVIQENKRVRVEDDGLRVTDLETEDKGLYKGTGKVNGRLTVITCSVNVTGKLQFTKSNVMGSTLTYSYSCVLRL